jgi:hypothetical protein
MKNKDFFMLISAMLVLIGILLYITGCTKIEVQPPTVIDLGKKSESTAIKQISIVENIVSAKFQTTSGAKYSVQVLPFGSDEPVMKDGFTATDTITSKIYNLKGLPKQDYDVIFIDIQGKEIKYPITIK